MAGLYPGEGSEVIISYKLSCFRLNNTSCTLQEVRTDSHRTKEKMVLYSHSCFIIFHLNVEIDSSANVHERGNKQIQKAQRQEVIIQIRRVFVTILQSERRTQGFNYTRWEELMEHR